MQQEERGLRLGLGIESAPGRRATGTQRGRAAGPALTLGLPSTTTPYLARVSATFRRRGSLRKPMPCRGDGGREEGSREGASSWAVQVCRTGQEAGAFVAGMLPVSAHLVLVGAHAGEDDVILLAALERESRRMRERNSHESRGRGGRAVPRRAPSKQADEESPPTTPLSRSHLERVHAGALDLRVQRRAQAAGARHGGHHVRPLAFIRSDDADLGRRHACTVVWRRRRGSQQVQGGWARRAREPRCPWSGAQRHSTSARRSRGGKSRASPQHSKLCITHKTLPLTALQKVGHDLLHRRRLGPVQVGRAARADLLRPQLQRSGVAMWEAAGGQQPCSSQAPLCGPPSLSPSHGKACLTPFKRPTCT